MRVNTVDHYEVLAIGRNAEPDVIRSAWRRLARRYHPDVTKERGAARRFMRIREAYEVLSDAERRRRYDAWLERISPSPPRRPPTTATRGHGSGAAKAGAGARGGHFEIDVLGIIQIGVTVGSAGVAREASAPRPRHRRT
jgi:curved DNA-binding protein